MKALVTGASEGIGRAFAVALSQRGYEVTAVARNEVRLQHLMNEFGGGGGRSHSYLVADLSKAEDVQRLVTHLKTEKFDLLVNNAGLATYGPFREMPAAAIQEMLTVNVESLIALAHAFLETAVPGNTLVNVSSTASFLPMPITSIYAGTKAFVTSFSQSLWYEERKRDVYVLALCPGTTNTKFHIRSGGRSEKLPRWFAQTPEQVVQLALKYMKRRRQPVAISGPQKYLIFLTRFLPRRLVTLLAGRTLEWGMKAF